MTPTYTDNSVVIGAAVVTFATAGTVVLEDLTLNFPWKLSTKPNQIGEPAGNFMTREQPTGNAIAQTLSATADGTSGFINPPDSFTISVSGTNQTWVVSSVGRVYPMGQYLKCNLSLFQAHPYGLY